MGDTSQCSHPTETLQSSIGIWAWGLLTDWRYWAVALALGLFGALISAVASAMGWASGYIGGGAMAGLGIYAALSMGRIHKCGRCGKIVRFPLGKPPAKK